MRASPRTALAAAVAVAGMAGLAGPAGASPAGAAAYQLPRSPQAPVVTNAGCAHAGATDCGKAGYEAAGRAFRYAQALITVPARTGSVAADPAIYVGLATSAAAGGEARAGVRPCLPGGQRSIACPAGDRSGWEIFAAVRQPGSADATIGYPVPAGLLGRGLSVSIYASRTHRTVTVQARLAGGRRLGHIFTVRRPAYDQAAALADWSADTAAPRPAAPPSGRNMRFRQGSFTTAGGQRGTFLGPWTLRQVEATSTGQPSPRGTLVAAPGPLGNDHRGHGPGDTFIIHLTAAPPAPAPVAAGPPQTWLKVSTGYGHVCGIRTNHTLWCWGDNGHGQFGDGSSGTQSAVPVQEATHAADWAAVAAGYFYTCATKTDGTLWCWGDNSSGQLGDGSITERHIPVQEVTHATDWATVTTGSSHTCATKTDGTLWCWGHNNDGQLGNGRTADSSIPVQEATHTADWATVTGGYQHTCAVETSGHLWCWGDGSFGQIGPASNGSTVPVPVPSPATSWAAVSAGYYHTCATKTDGTLWCWGYGYDGELGDGTTTTTEIPVQEATHASDWAAVSADSQHTCALKAGGSLWCWGENADGQLGDGTTTGSLVPVQEITHSTDWASVSADFASTCAIRTSGSLWCWGFNGNGQLGNGTYTGSTVPVQVIS